MDTRAKQVRITKNDIKRYFDRYKSGQKVKRLAEELGITEKSLRMRFCRQGLVVSREYNKKKNAVETSPYAPVFGPALEESVERVDPRLCATCMRRNSCESGTKLFEECYFVKEPVKKPMYVKDTSMF